MIQVVLPTLPAETARPAKPAARPRLVAHPGPMLVDPRLGVGFGFEHADPSRMTAWDAYLDTERPVVKRDDAVGCLGVRVCFWHFMRRDIDLGCSQPTCRGHARKESGNSFSAPQAEQVAASIITRWAGPMLAAMTSPQLPHK
jgi:hypothetical protein